LVGGHLDTENGFQSLAAVCRGNAVRLAAVASSLDKREQLGDLDSAVRLPTLPVGGPAGGRHTPRQRRGRVLHVSRLLVMVASP
jgi:hypothetical protein